MLCFFPLCIEVGAVTVKLKDICKVKEMQSGELETAEGVPGPGGREYCRVEVQLLTADFLRLSESRVRHHALILLSQRVRVCESQH